MKNTMGDLSLHLFAQLERLGDESLKGEALKEEIERARAVSKVAEQIVSTASVVITAIKVEDNLMAEAPPKMPRMLEGGVTRDVVSTQMDGGPISISERQHKRAAEG